VKSLENSQISQLMKKSNCIYNTLSQLFSYSSLNTQASRQYVQSVGEVFVTGATPRDDIVKIVFGPHEI
jgi:hypothetical protein